MSGINNVQTRRFPRYNLPFHQTNTLSGQMGRLIPIQCDEVNAGERWNEKIDFILRMSPLIHPAMVMLDVHFYSFFVPTRIITPRNSAQSTWEKMIESINKPSEEQPILPSIYTSKRTPIDDDRRKWLQDKFGIGTLSDYLDVFAFTPQEIMNSTTFHIPFDKRISLNGFLCYLSIYNWWFRRDQIEKEITFPLSLGACDLYNVANSQYVKNEEWTDEGNFDFYRFFDELFKLRYKNYERDYFTSSLPSPQYGEDVKIGSGFLVFPENMNFPVSGLSYLNLTNGSSSDYFAGWQNSIDGGYLGAVGRVSAATDGIINVSPQQISKGSVNIQPVSGSSGLHADLSRLSVQTNSFTINELRLAMQMQAVCETINRGGTRYVEIMQNVYGSIVPDARLQQPVYLGGQKFPIQIGTVVQTSQTSDSAALGTLAGKAQAANGGKLFRTKKKFDEAGYIMTLACVVPRTGYSNGMPRKWLKRDVLDFFNPYFSHVGEQPVYNAELYYNPLDITDENIAKLEDTFGWQERYAEYRHPVSRVHGEMRYSKNDWHLSREFDETPSLNTDFIKMDVSDFTRIFEYEELGNSDEGRDDTLPVDFSSDEMFDMMLKLTIYKKTPVPKFGTPYSFI